MKKSDIRNYTAQELTMLVENREELYNCFDTSLEQKNINFLMNVLNDLFIYNSEQLAELEDYFNEAVDMQEWDKCVEAKDIMTNKPLQSDELKAHMDIIRCEARRLGRDIEEFYSSIPVEVKTI